MIDFRERGFRPLMGQMLTENAIAPPEVPTYPIDPTIAQAVVSAIVNLEPKSAEVASSWSAEPCWFRLKVQEKDALAAYQRKLASFLGSGQPELGITQDEYNLTQDILSCSQVLVQKELSHAGIQAQNLAAIAAIVGGIFALVALL